MRTGGRSASPQRIICPLAAARVRSLAAHAALGPSDPKAVTATVISRGCRARSPARSAAGPGAVPGAPVAITTSAVATSASRSTAPADSERLPRW